MRRALLVLFAACGGEDKARVEPAGSGSAAPPKETITVQLAGCSPALAAPADPRDRIAAIGTIGTIGGTGYGSPIRSSNAPRVVLSTPSVDGDLDAALVRRILRRHAAKFLYCFEKQAAVNPRLAGGIVETGFAIQSSGAVASPRADGVDPEVSKCVVNALATVAFPPPRDGNQVQVTAPIRIEYRPASTTPVAPVRPPARTSHEWTPFATEPPLLADADAKPVVEAVTASVRSRLAAVEHCFDGARGAVRAMIAIDPSGRIESTRAGGIGDSAIERCIATAISGFTVAPPPVQGVEVACDFTRGGDAPLRVSPDAGYTVLELTSREMRNRNNVREIPPRGTPPSVTLLGTMTSALIVAEPDAPGHGLEHALWWAPAGTTLVAVKASGGAPVLLGMGDSRAQRSPTIDKRVVQLRTDHGRMRACIPGETLDRSAPLLEPRTMDAVMVDVLAACKRAPCESTIVVGTSGEFVVKDLVATTSAARRAGLPSISIGGPACDP